MAVIKPGQLSSGPYNISGSFSGSFQGDGSNLINVPTQSFETGSFVLTSSFDTFTGSYNTGSFTGSFTGSLLGVASTASYVLNAVSASYSSTSSYVENAQTASYVLNAVSSSYASVANSVNDLNQNVFVSGALTVLGGATFYGSSSFVYVTASQLAVSASFISVNVFEPAQRFGGLYVYDSGSSNATASLAWDSLHNHWIYQNVSGATYTGGMFLSGPRNTGSLGDEPTLTKWFIPRGDGGDHLDNTQIYSSGSIHIVTGSLTVTQGLTGSLLGTSSYATQALSASFASTVPASGVIGLNLSQIATASFTASVSPTQFTITSASIQEFTVTGTGVTVGNALTDTHNVTGSLNITGSQTITGSLTATQLGVGAAPSSSVRLDVRAQGTGTSPEFRVRNSGDTYNIISAQGNGNIQIGSDAVGTTRTVTIAGTNTSQINLDTSFSTDTATISVSRRISPTFNTNVLLFSQNAFSDGNVEPYKFHFVNPSSYWGYSEPGFSMIRNAGFMFFKDSATAANLQMKLTPDNVLTIYTGSLGAIAVPTEVPVTGSAFQLFASSSNNTIVPVFIPRDGKRIQLYAQGPVTSSQGLADALTNLGFLTGSSTITTPSAFPFTGSALITGSLGVTGSISLRRSSGNGLMFLDQDGRIAIGYNANITNHQVSDLSIGYNASIGAGAGGDRIAIGRGATTSLYYGTAIGLSANVNSNGGLALGCGASTTGGDAVNPQIAIGMGVGTSAPYSIMIGNVYSLSTTAINNIANSFMIHLGGSGNGNYQNFFVNSNSNIVLRRGTQLTSSVHFDTTATNTLTLHSGSIPATTISGALQFYAATGSISNNVRPHFRTGNGTTVWLGDESRLFNVTASNITASNITASSLTVPSGSITITTGSITMPNRPAFRVTGAGGGKVAVTTLSGSYLNVDYQQGSGWDNSTGTFTAPIAGLYQVNVVVRTNSNSLGVISQLIVYKNNTGGTTGTPQIMVEFGTNTSMNHAGGSTISKLEVGDTLKMVVASGEISFDANDNFSVAYIG